MRSSMRGCCLTQADYQRAEKLVIMPALVVRPPSQLMAAMLEMCPACPLHKNLESLPPPPSRILFDGFIWRREMGLCVIYLYIFIIICIYIFIYIYMYKYMSIFKYLVYLYLKKTPRSK
jgi:hypothetical protein